MKTHTPDSVTTVALSYAQMHELIRAASDQVNPTPDLREAKAILRRQVKDIPASNDSTPQGKTA